MLTGFDRHQARYRWAYLVLFYSILLYGTYLGMRPEPPPTPHQFNMVDALYHAGGLFVCTLLSYMAHPRWRWWWRGGFMFSVGVAVEYVQSFHPTRTADIGDIYSNTVGVALGLLVVMGWQRWITRR